MTSMSICWTVSWPFDVYLKLSFEIIFSLWLCHPHMPNLIWNNFQLGDVINSHELGLCWIQAYGKKMNVGVSISWRNSVKACTLDSYRQTWYKVFFQSGRGRKPRHVINAAMTMRKEKARAYSQVTGTLPSDVPHGFHVPQKLFLRSGQFSPCLSQRPLFCEWNSKMCFWQKQEAKGPFTYSGCKSSFYKLWSLGRQNMPG